MAAARMSEAWQASGQAVYDTQEDLAAGLPSPPTGMSWQKKIRPSPRRAGAARSTIQRPG